MAHSGSQGPRRSIVDLIRARMDRVLSSLNEDPIFDDKRPLAINLRQRLEHELGTSWLKSTEGRTIWP